MYLAILVSKRAFRKGHGFVESDKSGFVNHLSYTVIDAATMGARRSQSYYFTEDTSDDSAKTIMSNTKSSDFSIFVKEDVNKGSSTESASAHGQSVSYATSEIEQLGEYSSIAMTALTAGVDDCRIGWNIIPQVRVDFPLTLLLHTSIIFG